MQRILVLAGVLAAVFASIPGLIESRPGRPELPAVERQAERRAQPVAAGRGKVRLDADGGGHFGGDFRLNGRAVPAMVDTGATYVAINRTTARRIGLRIAEADFTASANTANGRVRVAPAIIERIAIGRIELRDVQAVVLDDRALSGTLVGMSFLSRLGRYSVEDGTLVLEE